MSIHMRAQNLLCILVLCAFSVQTTVNWRHNGQMLERLDTMSARLDALEASVTSKGKRKVMTTEWMSGGQRRSLTSVRGELDVNESFSDFLMRHKDEVREAQVVFPKDPP